MIYKWVNMLLECFKKCISWTQNKRSYQTD